MSIIEYATKHPDTRDFMAELIALFDKHNLAIVPVYDNRISFHDTMRVVPLDQSTLTFIRRTGFDTGVDDEEEES